jgi:hypothetical protein
MNQTINNLLAVWPYARYPLCSVDSGSRCHRLEHLMHARVVIGVVLLELSGLHVSRRVVVIRPVDSMLHG